MLEDIADQAIRVDNIRAVTQQYEQTRQTVAQEIAKIVMLSASRQKSNIAGKFKDGKTDWRFLEYYKTHKGEIEIGFPDNRSNCHYIHWMGNGHIQDFDGGNAGICVLMAGVNFPQAFLLKAPFFDTYWHDGRKNWQQIGFPTSDQYQSGSVLRQDFERGFMTFNPDNDEVLICQSSKR